MMRRKPILSALQAHTVPILWMLILHCVQDETGWKDLPSCPGCSRAVHRSAAGTEVGSEEVEVCYCDGAVIVEVCSWVEGASEGVAKDCEVLGVGGVIVVGVSCSLEAHLCVGGASSQSE